ncbi:MAG: hypothetical protein BA864_13125 [Desulfuromonadales bacterium C00003093]|nr:MAG: hypothetical protein BA864_13125 [Desulfuromonadales bacterium C00003093]
MLGRQQTSSPPGVKTFLATRGHHQHIFLNSYKQCLFAYCSFRKICYENCERLKFRTDGLKLIT